MADDRKAGPGGEPTGVAQGRPAGGPSRHFWLIPALTFVVGLLLGGGLAYAAYGGDAAGAGKAPAQETRTPTPKASGDLAVTVPAECLEAIEVSEDTFGTVREGIEALRGLDAEALRRIVDDLQTAQPRVERLARECRAAGDLPTRAPAP